ncbi:hypothetical protein GCM10009841_09630 [Microlunatus panaciterrae]|uniref:Protein translocase subunit SecE n=1 Tax=Microlunatus panaciterrae TaxID=400768 RepID=A0ABS2RKH9_9ACTN|nr:preprotein translocase subunit SecE [Microlunatus panaciterrae]
MADEREEESLDEPTLSAADSDPRSDDGPDADAAAADASDGRERGAEAQPSMDEQGAVEDQLVSVGAAQRRAARDREAGKERSAAAKGRGKKDKATPKQRQAARTQRTGPVKFVNEAIGELRKVVYPTGQQLLNYFVVVLVFVLFIIGIVSLLDLGFGWAILKIFS